MLLNSGVAQSLCLVIPGHCDTLHTCRILGLFKQAECYTWNLLPVDYIE